MGLLANPHWTTPAALVLWSLLLLQSPARGALPLALVLANLLALTRPYEPVLLLGMLTIGALRERELRARALLLALALLPWAGYELWLTRAVPAFSFHMQTAYPALSILDVSYALGPAALLALLALRVRAPGDAMRRSLATWVALAALSLLIRRPGPQFQFLVGIGLPLLALGAVGLSCWRPRVTWAAAAVYGVSAAVAVTIVWRGDPHWFVRAERWNAALALRPLCQGPDVVLAPPDIGLHVNALTRCRAFVSHEVAPDYYPRFAQLASFYGPADPASRAALLDAACAAHVVLPGVSDERPVKWLGPETAFRRSAVVGAGSAVVEVHSRALAGCPPAPPR
jgi:hypothetical protein